MSVCFLTSFLAMATRLSAHRRNKRRVYAISPRNTRAPADPNRNCALFVRDHALVLIASHVVREHFFVRVLTATEKCLRHARRHS